MEFLLAKDSKDLFVGQSVMVIDSQKWPSIGKIKDIRPSGFVVVEGEERPKAGIKIADLPKKPRMWEYGTMVGSRDLEIYIIVTK